MMSSCVRFVLLGLFLVFITPLLSSAENAGAPDRLILNDGEVIRINLTRSPDNILKITQGKAERVPRDARKQAECGGNTVELDVSGRNLSLKTGAEQLVISGARQVSISGIALPDWGSCDRPALYVERDCRVTLTGQTPGCAFIEIHPLAIASVDARGLAAKEIIVIGNAQTNVLHKPDTKVSFSEREKTNLEVRTSGNAGDWTPTPDVTPPPPAPQQTPAIPATPVAPAIPARPQEIITTY